MRRVPWYMVVDQLHGFPVSYCLSCRPFISSMVSSASLINQSGSSALPAVMHSAFQKTQRRSAITMDFLSRKSCFWDFHWTKECDSHRFFRRVEKCIISVFHWTKECNSHRFFRRVEKCIFSVFHWTKECNSHRFFRRVQKGLFWRFTLNEGVQFP